MITFKNFSPFISHVYVGWARFYGSMSPTNVRHGNPLRHEIGWVCSVCPPGEPSSSAVGLFVAKKRHRHILRRFGRAAIAGPTGAGGRRPAG
jgi:hypothetical protein